MRAEHDLDILEREDAHVRLVQGPQGVGRGRDLRMVDATEVGVEVDGGDVPLAGPGGLLCQGAHQHTLTPQPQSRSSTAFRDAVHIWAVKYGQPAWLASAHAHHDDLEDAPAPAIHRSIPRRRRLEGKQGCFVRSGL